MAINKFKQGIIKEIKGGRDLGSQKPQMTRLLDKPDISKFTSPQEPKKVSLLEKTEIPRGFLNAVTRSGDFVTRLVASLVATPFVSSPLEDNGQIERTSDFVMEPFKGVTKFSPEGKFISEEATDIIVKSENGTPTIRGTLAQLSASVSEIADPVFLALGAGTELSRAGNHIPSLAEALLGTSSKSSKGSKLIKGSDEAIDAFTETMRFGGKVDIEAPALKPVTIEQRLKSIIKTPDDISARVGRVMTDLDEFNRVPKPYTRTRAILKNEDEIRLLKNLIKTEGKDAPLSESVTKLFTRNVNDTSKLDQKFMFNINKNMFNVSDNSIENINKSIEQIRPQLESIKGAKMTEQEVIDAASQSDILRRVVSRDQSLKENAAVHALKQQIAAQAKDGTLTNEFVQNLKVLSSESARRGRALKALDYSADPLMQDAKTIILRELAKRDIDTSKLIKAAEGVDFNDFRQVTNYYRKFVKPTFREILDEFRYNNLLSSPATHIVNAFTGWIQTLAINPAVKMLSGTYDMIGSKLTGKAQTKYVSEVPVYYRGVLNSVGEAYENFADVMSGRNMIRRPDINRIPTGSKALKPFQGISRALEGADVFLRTLIAGGEKESIALSLAKQGKKWDINTITTEAVKRGEYWLFRAPFDATNKGKQGYLLSALDGLGELANKSRKIPKVGSVISWYIPFVRTPMKILAQGLEFSPAGFINMVGSADKTTVMAKATIGSTVFAGAAWATMNGEATWSPPTGEKEKQEFYATGRMPYSIKIGDNWVSYSRLGPLAYPISMAAAVKWHFENNSKNVTASTGEKVMSTLASVAGFFADQSYVQGMGDFLKAAQGDEAALSKALSNFPRQLIPLSALSGLTARLIDPIFRKTPKGFDPKSIFEALLPNLPFLSKKAEPYRDPIGNPSVRQNNLFNQLSPIKVQQEQPQFEELYQAGQNERVDDRIKRAINEVLKDKSLTDKEKRKKLNEIEQNAIKFLSK